MDAGKKPADKIPAENSGDAAATGQSGSGGGGTATDVGSRDDLKRETTDDDGITRATKQDKLQPRTGTRADHEGGGSD